VAKTVARLVNRVMENTATYVKKLHQSVYAKAAASIAIPIQTLAGATVAEVADRQEPISDVKKNRSFKSLQ